MRVISNNTVKQEVLQTVSLKRDIKSQSAVAFMAVSEKSIKARNIAKRLFKSTKPSDWEEPFMKKWFSMGKATRVYDDKQYGKVTVELFPIIKTHVAKQPIFVENKKVSLFDNKDEQPTTARMIIPAEGIDITTQEYHHPVMQLALDVIRDENGSSTFNDWF